MRKIAKIVSGFAVLTAVTFGSVAKAETVSVSANHEFQVGPGKNYRAKLARSYFGKSSCRKWSNFCGR
ncbi:MAG: hypothetical protein QXF12_03585 [Candidatus Aenigmatarchaeota archaeon]